jgi:cysteine desulfurase
VTYLDNNATTRTDPRVVDAMHAALVEAYGNPSSAHAYGTAAAQRIDRARAAVARLLGVADPECLTFTSGGSESINMALRSAAALAPQRTRIAATRVEHAAVLATIAALCDSRETLRPRESIALEVDAEGAPLWQHDYGWLDERVALVSVQWVNNETGVVTPLETLRELGRRCRSVGAHLHIDAVQACGKMELRLESLGADSASVSAHKLHGPKGVGALWMRAGLEAVALIRGGPQEHGRRAGTENVPGIVGFGVACDLAREWLATGGPARLAALRDELERGLVERCAARVHAARSTRVANTSYSAFPGVQAEALQMLLDAEGIAVSTGSACSSELQAPSHVLLAMGCSVDEATASLRFSLSRETERGELAHVVDVVERAVADLRALAPPP